MLGDLIKGLRYNYRYFLCKPDKTIIGNELQVINPEYSPSFRKIDELSFEINYYTNDWLKEKDSNFDLLKNDYLILQEIRYNDELKKQQYFIIKEITARGIDKDIKQVQCFSYESILKTKKIRSFKEVRKLYDGQTFDLNDNTKGGILDYILQYKLFGDWSVAYISPSLLDQYRSFDISEQDIMEAIEDFEKTYHCVFEFDTVTNSISIKLLSEIGTNKGLVLSEQNYLKNIQVNTKTDEIITRLSIYGAKNIGIYSKNIGGHGHIDDFTFYRTTDHMSQSLLDAMDAYDVVVANNQGLFETYLDSLITFNETLSTKQNELTTLKIDLLTIIDNENASIVADNHTNYSTYHSQAVAKRSEIATKESEIAAVQAQIAGINGDINILRNVVAYSNNFTADQLKELSRFVKEETVNVNNIDDEDVLYQYGLDYMAVKSVPVIEFSLDSVDILSSEDAQLDWDKFELADIFNLNYSKLNIHYEEIRLVGYKHNPHNNSLSLEFSNQDERNLNIDSLVNKLAKTYQTSTTVEIERQANYNSYIDEKGNIIYLGSTIDSSLNSITTPDGSSIDENGFSFKDSSTAQKQMKIVGDRLVITNDGWTDFNTILSGDGLKLTNSNQTVRVYATLDDGFKIDLGNGAGSWESAFYVDVVEGVPKLFLAGNAVFTGEIQGSIITGGIITGATITGGTIKTSVTGARVELSSNRLVAYNASGNRNGLFIAPGDNGDVYVYSNGVVYFVIRNLGVGGCSIEPINGSSLGIGGTSGEITYMHGNINFDGCTNVTGLDSWYATLGNVQFWAEYIANLKMAAHITEYHSE